MIDETDRAQHNAKVNLVFLGYTPQTLLLALDPDVRVRIG